MATLNDGWSLFLPIYKYSNIWYNMTVGINKHMGKRLIIMKGLPGSGKSTRAKELMKLDGHAVRLNRDLLREMFHFGKWNHKNEAFVIRAETLMAKEFLTAGSTVIIDDTNLSEDTVNMWKLLASEIPMCKVHIEDVKTDVDECVNRDEMRGREGGRLVGESVIRNMALRYNRVDPGELVVVDMDGTLADCDHRRHFVEVNGTQKKDWKQFMENMDKDTLRQEVWEEVRKHTNLDHKLIIVSARSDDFRAVTEKWLDDNRIPYWTVIMRNHLDGRSDVEVKSDIYDQYLKQYKVVKVFDDRPSVIRMWREKGLLVEDVGKGIEF